VTEPGIDGPQRAGIQLVYTLSALTVLLNEMGAAQQAQVLRNSRTGDGKGLGDSPGGQASLA
jgi:hypothetical protein